MCVHELDGEKQRGKEKRVGAGLPASTGAGEGGRRKGERQNPKNRWEDREAQVSAISPSTVPRRLL